MTDPQQHSMKSLSKATKVSTSTLRIWRLKGWLKPSSKVGTHERFSLDSFDAARLKSLESTMPEPSMEQDPEYYRRVNRSIS